MFRSQDLGNSWQKINNGLDARYIRASIAAPEPFSPDHFVDDEGGVYRSMDYGDTWEEVNNGMITTDVRALGINSSGHIFAATYLGGGVYRSTNNGDN